VAAPQLSPLVDEDLVYLEGEVTQASRWPPEQALPR